MRIALLAIVVCEELRIYLVFWLAQLLGTHVVGLGGGDDGGEEAEVLFSAVQVGDESFEEFYTVDISFIHSFVAGFADTRVTTTAALELRDIERTLTGGGGLCVQGGE